MSFRKEKKYQLTKSEMVQVKKRLFLLGMKELFTTRTVNSCYFDTKNLSFHHDSEEGVLPRKKVRIRWYNDEKNYKKEIKYSSIEGRYKYSDINKPFKDKKDIFSIKYLDKNYGEITPTVFVKYKRDYFIINRIRLTFDSEIIYQNLKSISKYTFQDSECVMEIKAPISCDDDYIKKLINHSTSRFSKYSRGIRYITGYF